jgi:hypothetical protein
MTIVEQINAVMANDALDGVKAQSAPMHAIYLEMERNGYTSKQGYTISSMDMLAIAPRPEKVRQIPR